MQCNILTEMGVLTVRTRTLEMQGPAVNYLVPSDMDVFTIIKWIPTPFRVPLQDGNIPDPRHIIQLVQAKL